jgi:predicted TIM-barrel fold metal-dependent hydrolase
MGLFFRQGEGAILRPTIDGHHHLWQLGRFPYAWLAPDSPPRPFGVHDALKRDYLLADYLRDIAGANIVASVFVEANAGSQDADEMAWVDEVAGAGRLPGAAIGSLDLRRPDVERVLDLFCRSRRMRGVRMSLCWDERSRWRFIDAPDVMVSPEFQAGLATLTRRGLVLDALVVPGQLHQLAELARANPEQLIVLNHLGTPLRETADDVTAWRQGMEACGGAPNIAVKISGLWPIDRGWRPEIIGPPVRFVIDQFGPERCLWASNMPVEGLMCPVGRQLENLEAVLDGFSEAEKDMIFRETAARVYRIPQEG